MTTRTKFVCIEVTKAMYWGDNSKFLYTARFNVVTDGSPENKSFFAFTPSGDIRLSSFREDTFVPGKMYYVDFTEAINATDE